PAQPTTVPERRRSSAPRRTRPPGRSWTDAELAEDRRGVEVDALADDQLAVEEEEGDHAAGEGAPRGWNAAQRTAVGAEQVELDDDGVVGVMDDVDDVALVGECRARGGVVAADRFLAVVHLAGGDQLVA